MNKKWFFPFITHGICFPLLVIFIPWLQHKIHHHHKATIAVIILLGACGLTYLNRTHKMKIWTLGLLLGGIWRYIHWAWPKEQMGNWGLQYGGHVISTYFINYVASLIDISKFKSNST